MYEKNKYWRKYTARILRRFSRFDGFVLFNFFNFENFFVTKKFVFEKEEFLLQKSRVFFTDKSEVKFFRILQRISLRYFAGKLQKKYKKNKKLKIYKKFQKKRKRKRRKKKMKFTWKLLFCAKNILLFCSRIFYFFQRRIGFGVF